MNLIKIRYDTCFIFTFAEQRLSEVAPELSIHVFHLMTKSRGNNQKQIKIDLKQKEQEFIEKLHHGELTQKLRYIVK